MESRKGIYANLGRKRSQDERLGDSKFSEYIPEQFAAAKPREGKSAKVKADERQLRVVAKEKAKASVKVLPVIEAEGQGEANTARPCATRNCCEACLTVEDKDHEGMMVDGGIPLKAKRRTAGYDMH